jgi:transcriptional regulator with GAF, ATPase, and Fis domain
VLVSEPLDLKFLAAIMRRVYENSPATQLAAEYARGKEAGYEEGYDKGAKLGHAAANLEVFRRQVKGRAQNRQVTLAELPDNLVGREESRPESSRPETAAIQPLEITEREQIVNALRRSASTTEAANQLGIHFTTLYRKRKKYGIKL